MAATYNISITRGDRWTKKFRFNTTTAPDPPAYVDFTGATGKAMIRQDADDVTPWCTGVVTFASDATGWYCQVVFMETETDDHTGSAVWDLEITLPGAGPFTYLSGVVSISKDVSR